MLEYCFNVLYLFFGCLFSCFYLLRRIVVMCFGEDGLLVSVELLRLFIGRLDFNGFLDII